VSRENAKLAATIGIENTGTPIPYRPAFKVCVRVQRNTASPRLLDCNVGRQKKPVQRYVPETEQEGFGEHPLRAMLSTSIGIAKVIRSIAYCWFGSQRSLCNRSLL
jgi:hypothetical protein